MASRDFNLGALTSISAAEALSDPASSSSNSPSSHQSKWQVLSVADAFFFFLVNFTKCLPLPLVQPHPPPFPCPPTQSHRASAVLSTHFKVSVYTPVSHRSALCSPCTCRTCRFLLCRLGRQCLCLWLDLDHLEGSGSACFIHVARVC